MTPRYPKRLIEVDLPIKRISAHARREKSIRHGHISTLHIWWARRPLAACRAVICASLWPDPADENCPLEFLAKARNLLQASARRFCTSKEGMEELIVDLSNDFNSPDPAKRRRAEHEAALRSKIWRSYHALSEWTAAQVRDALLDFLAWGSGWEQSTLPHFSETAKALTLAGHEALVGESDARPLVVDPFAGGGSIPLEAIRVGADAFASDLNPVAVLLNKVTLQYIPGYRRELASEVRRWGAWILERAEKQLGGLYAKTSADRTPIAYLWARTVISEAPGQGSAPVEIPLIRSMWLAKKSTRPRALRWVRDKNGRIETQQLTLLLANGVTQIVQRPVLEIFEPRTASEVEKGTSAGGAATCPVTGYTMPVEHVRMQLEARRGGTWDCRLIVVVEIRSGQAGRIYRLPEFSEEQSTAAAITWLSDYSRALSDGDPRIPDGRINHLRGFFNIVLYGMKTWGDVFTPRQLAVLLTLSRLVQDAAEQVRERDFADALAACLALVIGRMADGNSSLTRWQTARELISNTFGRQALPMVWDFAEANPFCDATRSLESMFDWVIDVIEHESMNPPTGHAERASATRHPLPDHAADAVITDPPYYAAVPYADLSDFFYSWLAPALRSRMPALFAEPLTPKDDECVQLSHRAAMYRNKDSSWFETQLAQAWSEARRFVKPAGVGLFVFASKETNAWEAMLAALISSGWVVTASWPVDTEMTSRLRAQSSATLASSIHIFCRPRPNDGDPGFVTGVADWRDVVNELPGRIAEWMPRLAREGVVGADAIFSCLGPALEIFSRYARVEKANGDTVKLREYLEQVWAAVAKEALSLVFAGADTGGFEADARLTAMWLWTLNTGSTSAAAQAEADDALDDGDEDSGAKGKPKGGFTLEYDAARKIAQGLGAHMDDMPHLVEIKGDQARLLPVAERSRHLFGKDGAEAPARARARSKPVQGDLFADLKAAEEEGAWTVAGAPKAGETVLDRIHQSMILFATGRGEALRRFIVEEGTGRDPRFWSLAQALSALYPAQTDEKRWVDGVLARKKSFGF